MHNFTFTDYEVEILLEAMNEARKISHLDYDATFNYIQLQLEAALPMKKE